MNTVKLVKIAPDVVMPTKAHDTDAGFDLYAYCPDASFYSWESGCQLNVKGVKVRPNETYKFHTGIKMAIPDGYWGGIYARSGLATKCGLRPANCVGVIDSSYRGEIIVAIHNDSNETQLVHNGDRIAQAIVSSYEQVEFVSVESVEELSKTERGDGGFSHTGVK